jgi:hypothetical protein
MKNWLSRFGDIRSVLLIPRDHTCAHTLREKFEGWGKYYILTGPYSLGTTPVLISHQARITFAQERISLTNNRTPLARTVAGLMDQDTLFSYDGGYAEAIRLFGSSDECVLPQQLLPPHYAHSLYTTPPELQDHANKRIARLQDEAVRFNRLFFNGPNVRLMRWHHNQTSPTEADTLELWLGAAGWFDLEGTNNFFREEGLQQDAYRTYVDISKIQSGNFEEGCRLSNVIGNAVTIFTADGKVGFQRRSYRASAVPGWLTSTVAENVNRYKDDTRAPDVLINTSNVSSAQAKDPAYEPSGIPHPLSAVRRGLSYEVSPQILKFITGAIRVTGLAFGLDALAPDLLWLVLLDITEQEFLKIRRDRPGREVDEGTIEFVAPSFNDAATHELLMRSDWVAAGKASLVRAIQLIEESSPNGDPLEAFRALANAA